MRVSVYKKARIRKAILNELRALRIVMLPCLVAAGGHEFANEIDVMVAQTAHPLAERIIGALEEKE